MTVELVVAVICPFGTYARYNMNLPGKCSRSSPDEAGDAEEDRGGRRVRKRNTRYVGANYTDTREFRHIGFACLT